uniref:ATP-dependent RNA helicase n=1 Tax=Globisporangium ultimum (strain ATCC 200006 / CBS 805.95 / DAOM BR144) TaxID=431595 RepID=K3WZ51_GLOUD
MSGVKQVAGVNVVSAAPAPKQQSKKRKKRSSGGSAEKITVGGWKKVDLEDVQVEGFEDGCAFDLEEMTDYQLEKTETGGHILISSQQKIIADPSKKKKKKRSKSKADKADVELKQGNEDAAENEEEDDDALESEQHTAVSEKAEEKKAPSPVEAKPKKAKLAIKKDNAAPVVPKHLAPVSLPKWDKYKLHNTLMHSLKQAGFMAPTRIQEQTIYPALVDNRDVVGAAPTGSGKTLAFGLPILSQLLFEREQEGYKKDCKALILTPTRELALQIHQHLEKMVRNREIGIVTLVGGMAIQKQTRMLTYSPEIVIGTPGRLWDMIDHKHAHFKDLNSTLRFLVIDEADRMLQKGSYPEVEKIFDALRFNKKTAVSDLIDMSDHEESDEEEDGDGDDEDIDANSFSGEAKVMMLDDILKMQAKQKEQKEGDNDEGKSSKPKPSQPVESDAPRHVRQTFLFSATLTIPEGGRFQNGKKKHRHALTVLESVMKRVGMRGKPAVVDLSIDENASAGADDEARRQKQLENVSLSLPAGLELCQHEISDSNRDSFLYYFLTQYPGRTIVFLNAIHQVRKLTSLLSLLNLPVFALHAEMQQRQRLKKLDNFKAHTQGILIATDVAARGLDIPSVDYVVHYHIARSTEVFVHRSGRTARAEKDGLSISLVGPADAKYHAQICKMLQRPTGLSDFPFDHRYLPAVDERVRLAKSINEEENATGKVKSEETWFSQMAAAADLDMDDNLMQELKSKKDNKKGGKKGAESIEAQRAMLSRLLAEPLRPVGSIRKFRQLYQELGTEISGDGEYKKRNASEDLETKSKKSFKRFRKRK